jgi:hypothetical protein
MKKLIKTSVLATLMTMPLLAFADEPLLGTSTLINQLREDILVTYSLVDSSTNKPIPGPDVTITIPKFDKFETTQPVGTEVQISYITFSNGKKLSFKYPTSCRAFDGTAVRFGYAYSGPSSFDWTKKLDDNLVYCEQNIAIANQAPSN